MSIGGILIAAAIVGAVGIFVGLFLGVAGIKFKVEVNEKEEKIAGVLPGNNCGGCGYAGCAACAKAIANGEAPVNACPVGGDSVGEQIAQIMGVDNVKSVKKAAYVQCKGDCEKAVSNYNYTGAQDCRMLSFVPEGGPKQCRYGCLGYGSCVKACEFGAISVVDGIAVVDKYKCRACGKCVEACPRHLISLIPFDSKQVVACSSKDKGPVTMKACEVGCIGCGICQKNCPSGAITVTDFNATIDQENCTHCGICAEKCPKKCINSF